MFVCYWSHHYGWLCSRVYVCGYTIFCLINFFAKVNWKKNVAEKHSVYYVESFCLLTLWLQQFRLSALCWKSRDELISDVLLWIPTYGWAKAGRPARTYIQQLCEDTGCSPEDLPEVMNDREKWRERVRDICACGTTWWWWWSSICYNPKLASDWLKQSHLNWTNLQFVIRRSHVEFLTSHKSTYTFWMVWALNSFISFY